MAPDHFLFSRCVQCPNETPPCSCAPDETCVATALSCTACPTNTCVKNDTTSSSSSHSVSSGAVAGAVIASVIFLAVAVLAFLWYRKRQRQRQLASAAESKSDTPARAEDVLARQDPNEKPTTPGPQEPHTVRIYGGASNTTINLDPESQGGSVAATQGHARARESAQSNPFADNHSIQSASTGTQSNVIPIALVPPGSVSLRSGTPSSGTASGPIRPERTPDLDLNLEHANISNDNMRPNGDYAKSTRSGIRNSYMTTGSFASDLLNESPVIVTQSRSQMKQVVGLVKAEVIRTPPGSVYSSPEGAKSAGSLSVASSRQPTRSPLAGSSFGPLESMAEEQEHGGAHGQELAVRADPFGDEHSPYPASASPTVATNRSPAATTTTFGDSEQQWDPPSPRLPWTKKQKIEKHTSVNTQAGSIIGATISNASRVHLGLEHLNPSPRALPSALAPPPSSDLPRTPISAALSTARSQHRMTSAKIISPATDSDTMPTPSVPSGVLQRQQRQAIEDMEAARMSRTSVASTSTRADSILEGFPFVPPSPISDRPIRTPPRSPLAQSPYGGGIAGNATANASEPSAEALPPPPNRKMLGMSVASQSSTVSNGLGSFPFQIESSETTESTQASAAPSSFPGRQRASLDTLALTADLSSYPLGFDRDAAMAHYPGPSNRR
ncbi:hypothetical protein PHLGIDRAFT_240369 [Phlebiopsis gigantea 11061_1 CR5-6]|uniref:Membrane anchor Opy2 N-terminal domain-containing protein n=1 Tax=Phlebiopsis gigantea (strain 11061_1 CR5-6) TaxID=745531 RepID=A0A0C3SBW7_PHLG1|nr:hypothetical protein PHLGIDRAFT_240369 [Phlebiopsis gigantea 11061_1 CR5-6]